MKTKKMNKKYWIIAFISSCIVGIFFGILGIISKNLFFCSVMSGVLGFFIPRLFIYIYNKKNNI